MRSQIPAFAEHLAARQLALGTITPYLSELRRFAAFLEAEGVAFDGLSITQATRYFVREGRSSLTTRRALTILNQFLTWAKHPLAPELGAIRLPRAHQAAPDYLSEVEEKALRKALKARTDVRDQPRDRALFCLLLDTGIRISEAAGLTVGDVELDEKTIRLVTKGDKRRVRFLPVETRDLLRPLMAGQPAESAVFRTRTGRAVSDRHIRRLLDSWAKAAGIERFIHPHALRHTFATSLLKKTGNLRLVQLALDHESPKTTAIYAHVADEELRAAIEGRCK
ncbi:MAG: tyrosine-type recombinase/integrase [bacterium]|nr:tyrosine-type recombinase/integrase [bacterium]